MDGSNRRELTVVSMEEPVGLSLDYVAGRLYWISEYKEVGPGGGRAQPHHELGGGEVGLGRAAPLPPEARGARAGACHMAAVPRPQSIETLRVDGSGRHSFPSVLRSHAEPLGLAVFESRFFWADGTELVSASRASPREHAVLLRAPVSAFTVLHVLQQPPREYCVGQPLGAGRSTRGGSCPSSSCPLCSQGIPLPARRVCAATSASCPLCTPGAISVPVRRASTSCPRGSVQVSRAAGCLPALPGAVPHAGRGLGSCLHPREGAGATLTRCPCAPQSCPSPTPQGKPSPWCRWAPGHAADECSSGGSPSSCRTWTGRGRCSTGRMTAGRCCASWGTPGGEKPSRPGCQVRPHGVTEPPRAPGDARLFCQRAQQSLGAHAGAVPRQQPAVPWL